jgi:hypothetical protein
MRPIYMQTSCLKIRFNQGLHVDMYVEGTVEAKLSLFLTKS